MASIYDIAKEAGVAYSTVSLILNNRGDAVRISKKTQERVKKIAKEMGYVPNINARKLISKDVENIPEIALFWSPSQHAVFLNAMISKLNELVRRNEVHPMSVTIYPFETGQLPKLEKILTGNFAHGMIIPAGEEEDVKYLKQMDIQTPVITMYNDTKKYHSVDVDNYANGQKAAKVFESMGIKRVGVMKNVYVTLGVKQRMKGFKDYCLAHGMEVVAEITPPKAKDDDLTKAILRYNKGERMAEKLLSGKYELPQGIFVQDDNSARGVITELKEKGIRVPEDMAVICYGYNSDENEEYNRLTLVDFPIDMLAEKTWRLMSDILEDKVTKPEKIQFASDVRFGRSCPRPEGWVESNQI